MRLPPSGFFSGPSWPRIPSFLASSRSRKNAASPKAHTALKVEGRLPELGEVRQGKYLNTMVEQEHRFIKRLVKPGLGYFAFETAWRTLQGDEVRHLIWKGQVNGVSKGEGRDQSRFIASLFGVAA